MRASPTEVTDLAQFTETRIQTPRNIWLIRLLWLAAVFVLVSVAVSSLARFIQHPMQSCLCNSLRYIDQRDGEILLYIDPGGMAAGKIDYGDTLVAINGEHLPPGITSDEVEAWLNSYPPDTPLTLTLRTGDGPEGVVTLTTISPYGDFTTTHIIVLDIIQLTWAVAITLFIAVRRSDDWMALFSSYVLLAFAFSGMLTIGYGLTGFAWMLNRAYYNINANFLPVLLLMLFPDGKANPRWSLALSVVFGAWYLIAGFLFIAIDPLLDSFIYIVFAVAFVLVLRHRYVHVFTHLRRQQTKWVLLGIAVWLFVNGILQLVQSFFLSVGQDAIANDLNTPFNLLLNLITLIVPLTIMFAVLRYRLYDIDLVINRSLVYGAVSLGILIVFGIGFVATYVLTQEMFGSEFAVIPLAMGTLLSILSFNRLRTAAQHFVDRRIYRFSFDLNQLAAAQKSPNIKTPGALTGKTIGGYEVLGVLGKGGMGEVYQGQADGQTVALKILPEDLAQQAEFVSRFEREALTMRNLSHPNIVKLVSSGKQEGVHYLAMEFVEGADLGSRLQQNGKLAPDEVCPLMRKLAEALDYVHAQGLVHRDIKSSNVMLRENNPLQVVLMDFGIAKIKDPGTSYTGSNLIGTIGYMAPEQIMAAKAVDKRADVYALGVMAYEMLTGEKPFKGSAAQVMFAHLQQPPPDARDVVKDVPRNAAHAIERALAKDPDARFASAGEFAAALC